MASRVNRIVLTGGPCAGKSTALERIAGWLMRQGVLVFSVPEASTLLLHGGILPREASREQLLAFQRAIIRVQIALEDGFLDYAAHQDRQALLLCDRGVMDGGAYLPGDLWHRLRSETGKTEEQLLARYDAVVHLVTAANGAEPFYNKETNPDRYETLEEARIVDERLQRAWSEHPQHCIIGNDRAFEPKILRVIQVVSSLLGVTEP
jgi:predicted ATPase